MTTHTASRPMVPPSALREFRADFATVSAGAATALQYLGATRRRARDLEIVEATHHAALEVGRALRRMHRTESYLDRYGNWTALCRAVGIERRDSYDLIKLAEVTDNLEGAGVSTERLTRRQARVIARVDPANQAGLLEQARAEGDTTPAGLERLRRQLRAPIEAEAPRHRPERCTDPLEQIRRTLALLRTQVSKLPTADRCGPHLDALEATVNDAARAATDAA